MTNYKLVSSSNQMFPIGMVLPMDLTDLQIGDNVKFMNDDCICTQNIGAITLIKNSNGDEEGAVYSLVEDKPEEPKQHPLGDLIDTESETNSDINNNKDQE